MIIPFHATIDIKYTSPNLILRSNLKHATDFSQHAIRWYALLGPLEQCYNIVAEETQFLSDQADCELATLVLKYS